MREKTASDLWLEQHPQTMAMQFERIKEAQRKKARKARAMRWKQGQIAHLRRQAEKAH